jgi:hypothetical protein
MRVIGLAAAVLACASLLGCGVTRPAPGASPGRGSLVWEIETAPEPAAPPAAPAPPLAQPAAQSMVTARSDWSNVELPWPLPDLCRDLCLREDACRAFSYLSPGIDGPRARCLLRK